MFDTDHCHELSPEDLANHLYLQSHILVDYIEELFSDDSDKPIKVFIMLDLVERYKQVLDRAEESRFGTTQP